VIVLSCDRSGTYANPGSWFDPASADFKEPPAAGASPPTEDTTSPKSWSDLLGEKNNARTSAGASAKLPGVGEPRADNALQNRFDMEDAVSDAMAELQNPGSDDEDENEYDGGSLMVEVNSLIKVKCASAIPLGSRS